MNPPDNYDPCACEFPFPIAGTRVETCRKEVDRLRVLHSSIFRIAEQIATDMRDAECSARAETGWLVQRLYSRPLEKLAAAERQAQDEGKGFLLEDERDSVMHPLRDTDKIVQVWQDDETRAEDAALLTKYAAAIEAYVRNVSVGEDPEFDYSEVIKAGRKANADLAPELALEGAAS